LYKYYLATALSFLVLALIVLPFLEPSSPSFIVNLFAIALLLVLITLLVMLIKRSTKFSYVEE